MGLSGWGSRQTRKWLTKESRNLKLRLHFKLPDPLSNASPDTQPILPKLACSISQPPVLKFPQFFFLQRFCLFFRERKRGRETSICDYLSCTPLGTWPETQACALTGNRTCDPLLHRPALNPLSHTSPGSVSLVFNISLVFVMLTWDSIKMAAFSFNLTEK